MKKKRKQRAGTEQVKGEERSGARGKGGDLKGGKGRERENDPEDALEAGLFRAARRFPDDYSLRGSVFREGYLLRAHKPTETLEKRPASTRLRSKEVAREPPSLLPLLVEATTRLGQNEAMLPRSIRFEKRHIGSLQSTLARPAQASED